MTEHIKLLERDLERLLDIITAARAFRGYGFGPLSTPAVDMACRMAKASLEGRRPAAIPYSADAHVAGRAAGLIEAARFVKQYENGFVIGGAYVTAVAARPISAALLQMAGEAQLPPKPTPAD